MISKCFAMTNNTKMELTVFSYNFFFFTSSYDFHFSSFLSFLSLVCAWGVSGVVFLTSLSFSFADTMLSMILLSTS